MPSPLRRSQHDFQPRNSPTMSLSSPTYVRDGCSSHNSEFEMTVSSLLLLGYCPSALDYLSSWTSFCNGDTTKTVRYQAYPEFSPREREKCRQTQLKMNSYRYCWLCGDLSTSATRRILGLYLRICSASFSTRVSS